MNVVAMIKGEYQIKTIDVQDELNNKEANNKHGRISYRLYLIDRQKPDQYNQVICSLDVPPLMNFLIKIQIVKKES